MALSDLDPTSHPGKANIAMVLSKKTPSKSNNISEKRRFQMQLHRKHQKRANTWPTFRTRQCAASCTSAHQLFSPNPGI